MTKAAALLVALLLGGLLHPGVTSPEEHDSAQAYAKKSAEPAPALSEQPRAEGDEPERKQELADRNKVDPWAWPYTPELALSFFLLIATALQLVLLNQQHSLKKKLERPWMVVEARDKPENLQEGISVDALPSETQSHKVVEYWIRNCGPTPAWMTDFFVDCRMYEDIRGMSELPLPIYVDEYIHRGVREPVVPGREMKRIEVVPMDGRLRNLWNSRRLTIVLWGRIRYEGVFPRLVPPWRRKTYVTHFYWVFSNAPEAWTWFSGPEKYTRCT